MKNNKIQKELLNHELLSAAISGDLQKIKETLAKEADVNARDDQKCSALHWVSSEYEMDCVKELLNRGADVNAQDNEGNAPLHWAAHNGHLRLIKKLLTYNADIEIKDNYGDTPLFRAIKYSTVPTIEFLIDNGANINFKNEYGETALHIAASSKDLDAVRFLLKKGVNINAKDQYGNTPLLTTITNEFNENHFCIIELLVSKGADINAQNIDGNTLCHLFFQLEQINIINNLFLKIKKLSPDFNIQNKLGRTVLMMASYYHMEKSVKLLIEAGVNVNLKDNYGINALMFSSIEEPDEEIENMLKTAGGKLY